MTNNNGQPTRKEIQGAIDGLRIKEQQAQAELERADNAVRDAKLPQIETQREAASKSGVLNRAPVYLLEPTAEIELAERERKSAVVPLADIQRRIKSLIGIQRMMPE